MKDDKEMITSCISLIGGALLFPTMPVWGLTLAACGGLLLVRRILKNDIYSDLFKQLGLHKEEMYPELKEIRRTEYSTIRRYSLPPGLSLKDFEDRHEAIEQHIGKRISIKYHSKNIILEIFEDDMKHFNFEYRPHEGVKVEIGRKRNGECIVSDLSEHPHMLVASQTGGGKSTFEKCLITSFILKKIPLYLVDMKGGAEFHVFEPSRNVIKFGTTIDGAEETIEAFQAEINRRYQLFYDSNVKDVAALHKKGGKLPYSFLMIDEFATLTKSKGCMEMLYDILARGRAAGCLAIIATQHPSYEIIPGLLKANFCQTVAFRVKVPLYSEIILGCQGAEKLKGNGHGLFQCGDDLTEFQSPYIDDDIITPLIQHTFGKKDEKVIYGGFKC